MDNCGSCPLPKRAFFKEVLKENDVIKKFKVHSHSGLSSRGFLNPKGLLMENRSQGR